jgi:ectoine hydroxylase-related dioxygenase (phytanoyl-CoA dioxygenase family)
VACPLPPGGATFHHCRTLHYTAPNTSNVQRRAYAMTFHGPAARRAEPAHWPWALAAPG